MTYEKMFSNMSYNYTSSPSNVFEGEREDLIDRRMHDYNIDMQTVSLPYGFECDLFVKEGNKED